MTTLRSPHWTAGTQLLAVLLERFAPGQGVTITQADVEAAAFGTQVPVKFDMSGDGTSVTLTVERPEAKPASDKSGIPIG